MTKKALLLALSLLSIVSVLEAASDVSVLTGMTKGGKFSGTNPKVFKATKGKATAGKGPVTKALNGGKGVTIKTESAATGNGDLIVGAPIAKIKARTAKLTLDAVRDIKVNAAISSTVNGVSIAFKAGRGISNTAAINTNGADIAIDTVEPFSVEAPVSAGAGRILLQGGSVESPSPQTVTAKAVEVVPGALWRMQGTVAGDLLVSGVLAAGQLGTKSLQVNGALSLYPGATMVVNLAGTGKGNGYGSISASGAVSLAGTLQLDCLNGFEDEIVGANNFTIVSGGNITGTFDGLPDGSRIFLPDELGSLKITYTASSVTLSDWQPILIDQTWDPGDTDAGTFVHTNTRIRGKRHYFRVHTQETDIGAWRSRVNPPTGAEADLYIYKGALPSRNFYSRRSIHTGADGFVLNNSEFKAGEEWFLMVYADPGTPWTFLTGRAFVQDLGTLQWADSDSSGTYNIGEAAIPSTTGDLPIEGEGMRFFKATVPVGTPAWSLWLSGSNKDIAIRKSFVPFHVVGVFDRKQSGQMLVVPPYLGSGAATYFLSVVGNPGEIVNLDSRIQEVADIAFDSTENNVPVSEAPYRVYRLQVPVDQIAWDVSTIRLTGDPNVAVRRDTVPAEFDNDAFSEVVGDVSDSITLVPNFLTDGTWFITVYGKSSYSFTLRNGPPIVTPIQFTDNKINDQPQRTGWRYYALTDIQSQLGCVGWELELANQVPGTEIAIRRNAVPSRWRSRTNGLTNIISSAALDFSGTGGFLQSPGHQADIWYVGVYMPTQNLGAFSLSCHAMEPPTIEFNGGTHTINNLEPGRFSYVRVDVPAGAAGWDVRLRDVTGVNAGIAVRRDLPPALNLFGQLTNLGQWSPPTLTTWPTAYQWVGGVDWTDYTLNGPGLPVPNRLVMGMGRPLEPGTYYVGVYNSSTTATATCVLDSRGIGSGLIYPVTSIDYVGGTSTITDLLPREAQYFKVSIPPGSPSWELLLNVTGGEAEMVVRHGAVPDFTATLSGNIYDSVFGKECEMVKLGHERYVLLPPLGGSVIPEGDYYIAVVGEGVAPVSQTVGTGSSNGLITSVGPLAITELGTPPHPAGISHPVSLVPGQIKAYHFDVPDETLSLEVRLDNRVGAPSMVVVAGNLIPKPVGIYGADGGNGGFPAPVGAADSIILTVSNPPSGKWSIAINAGTVVNASGILSIKALKAVPVIFDGGTETVIQHQPGTVRYFTMDVPADAEGWDLRMRNVTGPMPIMVVRKDLIAGPPGEVTPGWAYWTFNTWPFAYQATAGIDWTGYSLDGTTPVPPRLVLGMRRPLQPGKYYVGVFNNSTTEAINYTIDSRGIGDGMTYPVTDLNYVTASVDINDLPPREARYFRVSIPPSTPTWEVTLSPGTGEMELLARHDAIPDFASGMTGTMYRQNPEGCEVEMKKTGPERYVLFSPLGSDFIPAGDYYLAVVSEGVAPGIGTIGAGASSGLLTSGPLLVKNLGIANASGTVESVGLTGGQIKAYEFTVPAGTDSLEVRLDDIQGAPWFSILGGGRFPTPPGDYVPGVPTIGVSPYNEYGGDGGNLGLSSTRILTVANPAPGNWKILMRAGHWAAPSFPFNPASANLVVTALSTVPLAYDGGTFSIVNQQPSTWRYFVVDVPAGVAGWDVRLKDTSDVLPAMMVRRDVLPEVPANLIPGFIQPGWQPWNSAIWPTLYQWLAGVDWTGYQFNSPGVNVPPRIVAGTGRPLVAGTYYVGVYNNTASPVSYTVDSRGIGDGRTYPVTELSYAGGTATISDLPGREARYFKVNIPASTPSWEVTLESTVGEVELLARYNTIPDFAAERYGSVFNGLDLQVEMRKAGPERYVLLPNVNASSLAAGDYYLAVVSQGVNPNATTIGNGSSSGVLTSVGALPATNLGGVTVGGISESVTLSGAQIKAYQFTVAPDTHSIELRLDNATGFPAMSVVQGSRFPIPPGTFTFGTFPHSEYGFDGGTGGTQALNIYTVASPTPGIWTVLVRARHNPQIPPLPADAIFPEAGANLVIRSKPNLPLNFAEALNAVNGGSHTDSRQAIDGEYNIYQVAVPPSIEGQAVLGWIIQTEVTQGAVSLEVYRNFADPTSGITIPTGIAVVVPPFLTFNENWYVRVKATGLTNYKITSRPVTIERPAWQMPAPHNLTFGDSGNDAAGNPLPGDRGVNLEEGNWHFYAVDVPADNQGLLRTELQAISGNPDLYLREDGVPTINHFSSGKGGISLAPRRLTGATTSYGNWVPLKGQTETRLLPGRWYIGVRAGGNSNVRYRLIVSTGTVNELALNPASATPEKPNSITEHSLPDNDWRYYRFSVPETAPKNWTVTFSQQVGDVVMWLRDTVPPGQTDANTASSVNIADWSSTYDRKNQGPYAPGYDAAGAYTFSTPPLRPGHTYYVGFRSNNSATFSLSSDTSGGPINVPPILDFYSGTVNTTIPANNSISYKIPVPIEGTRFKYTSTHAASVNVRIEQGTLAGQSGGQHFISAGTNSFANQPLSPTSWPWQPNQAYYVRIVNTSAVDQPITFTLNGKNVLNEDEDIDGLPDAWERQYFTNLNQAASGDPDNDGVNNATEFADGTIPNNGSSAKYTLTLSARNGTANALPAQAKYDKGAVVTLNDVPNNGYDFVAWTGGPFRGDDFALKATGTVTIPTSGPWTFGVNSADGFRLIVNGITLTPVDHSLHEARDTYCTTNLVAGPYPIELVAFEYRGSEALELFAAPGTFTSFNANFRLVGDVANGGLEVQTLVDGVNVPGFTVRQVESRSTVINSVASADALLNGSTAAAQSITGVATVVNFLTYGFSEGHFTDNSLFPLMEKMEDNPLQLPMNGNYTITALNSLPLGAAVDAEALVWRTGGTIPWIGANDPLASDTIDSASSGPCGDNQNSYMETTVTGPGTLTFRWKVSCQPTFDYLMFLIDGSQKSFISGEKDWAMLTYPIPAGTHTLTWFYSKDVATSGGTDQGWVDQVTFTP